ncbi:Cytochrome b5-like Heme/Steroid binding domain containing protein [Novymonas esmeraldas]|uniref:Cytochrome b5-like Heme/Steroid binding domain containing protein n=1 Tax=Novymonas esmeraldas TaxID=1808958 RepID=A0AAW0ET53_9TRYP
MATKYFRLIDVEKHNKVDDLWFIVDRRVYNVTPFADDHPGGPSVLLTVAGGDASNGFKSVGHSDSAKEELEKHYIGDVHPDDVSQLKESFQGTQSNVAGIVAVFILLAICFYCIARSLM